MDSLKCLKSIKESLSWPMSMIACNMVRLDEQIKEMTSLLKKIPSAEKDD